MLILTTASGTLDPEVSRLRPSLSDTRRLIHQRPEVGFVEARTAGLVVERGRALEAALPTGIQILVRLAERRVEA